MRYNTLGRTGLRVSEIGFGGAPAGLPNYLGAWNPHLRAAETQIVEAVTKAHELGINYFDTAPGYGDGASERMFGRAVQPFRDQVIIATKAFFTRRDDLLRSVDSSLERLQVGWIDVMQIHGTWYSNEQAQQILSPGGALEGLNTLRDQGLLRFIGFTTEGTNGAASQLIASGAFDVVQCCYNLVHQHPYDPERQTGLLYEAEAQQMGVATMRPLTSGFFEKWFKQIFGDLLQAEVYQSHLRQAMLAFVLSNPLVDIALVGMRSAAEVVENVAIADAIQARVDIAKLHERFVA